MTHLGNPSPKHKRDTPNGVSLIRDFTNSGGRIRFSAEKTRLQRLVSRLSDSLGRLFGKLQSIAMGRGTVLDYVRPEAQAVVDDLNELDNEEYEL